jgi:hypothetical protein
MSDAAALVRDDAVVRVLGRVLRQADSEGRLLHALEDEVDAVGIALCHAAQPRQLVIFGPFDQDRVIARVSLHPILVIGRPLAQRLLADLGDADDVAERRAPPARGATAPSESRE